MMAIEPGLHLLCLGEMGIGNTTSAAALCAALFGGAASDWVGPGTGVDSEGIKRKIAAVEAGLAANPSALTDPFEALRCLGGQELAAIMGPAKAAFAARWEQTAKDLYGSFLVADPVKFEMGRHLAWQFLQGLASSRFNQADEDNKVKTRLLSEFKHLMRQYWGLEG